MTDPKLVTNADRLNEDRLLAVQRLLGRSDDLKGLVTKDMRKAPTGVAETSFDTSLMERVALAIIGCTLEASERDGEPPKTREISDAVESAGCTMEMYLQMVQHPLWDEIYEELLTGYIEAPRMAAIRLAITNQAAMGDQASQKIVVNRQKEKESAEISRFKQMELAGEDGLRRELDNARRRISRLLLATDEIPVDEALQREAVYGIAKGGKEKEDRELKIDHSQIHPNPETQG